MNTPFISSIKHLTLFALALAATGLLTACGGGDSGPSAANPTGYYTGTASVVDGSSNTLTVSDLQGLVDGNHFMAMSETEELLYDGTLSINGNDYTASVTVYKGGAVVSGSPTNFSGQITQGSKITGTFSGTGAWHGTFTLNYELSNSVDSTLAMVATAADEFWGGGDTNFDTSTDPQFTVNTLGVMTEGQSMGGGVE